MTDGRVFAHNGPGGPVLTAEVTYPLPFVIGTLAAIPIGFVAGPMVAGVFWLWLVGANYVFALVAIRSHLKKASAPSSQPAR